MIFYYINIYLSTGLLTGKINNKGLVPLDFNDF